MPQNKEGKKAWWHANKERPEIREKHNAAALAYYHANKDAILAKRAEARAARRAAKAAARTPSDPPAPGQS